MPEDAETPASPPPAARSARPPGAREDFRYIVRFGTTDLDGARTVVYALQKVRGLGPRIAEAVADLASVPRDERIGNLPEQKTEELERIAANLHESLPPWMLNRQHDWDTGADLHLSGADVDLRRRDDINRMKMIRCYRGVRHETGQKVRGQRTRSNGRTGLTVGVAKKVAIQAAKAKEAAEGEEKKE